MSVNLKIEKVEPPDEACTQTTSKMSLDVDIKTTTYGQHVGNDTSIRMSVKREVVDDPQPYPVSLIEVKQEFDDEDMHTSTEDCQGCRLDYVPKHETNTTCVEPDTCNSFTESNTTVGRSCGTVSEPNSTASKQYVSGAETEHSVTSLSSTCENSITNNITSHICISNPAAIFHGNNNVKLSESIGEACIVKPAVNTGISSLTKPPAEMVTSSLVNPVVSISAIKRSHECDI
jgi:hypothetical protein